MKKKKLIIIIAAAVVLLAVVAGVVLFLVFGRGSGEEPQGDQMVEAPTEPEPEPIDAPIQYQVEEQSITALPVGGNQTLVTCEQDEETGISTYCYQGLPSVAQRVADYCHVLTAADFGFVPVDEEMYEIELPKFLPVTPEEPAEEGSDGETPPSEPESAAGEGETDAGTEGETDPTAPQASEDNTAMEAADSTDAATEPDSQQATEPTDAQEDVAQEGEVHLVLPVERVVPSETEGETEVMEGRWLLSLRVKWDEEQCLVTPEILSGSIMVPVEPTGPKPVPMTLTEAVDHIKSLPPADLGLPGESMEEYRIYTLDGLAMVGDTPCLRFNVYDDTSHDTNAIAGQYLLSGDGLHMYQITAEGTVRLLY